MTKEKGAIKTHEVGNVSCVYLALVGLGVPLFIFVTHCEGMSDYEMVRYECINRLDVQKRLHATDLTCMVIARPSNDPANLYRIPFAIGRTNALQRIETLFETRIVSNAPVRISPDAWLTGWDCFCRLFNLNLNSRSYADIGAMFRGVGLSPAEASEVMDSMLPEWIQAFKTFRIPELVRRALEEMIFQFRVSYNV